MRPGCSTRTPRWRFSPSPTPAGAPGRVHRDRHQLPVGQRARAALTTRSPYAGRLRSDPRDRAPVHRRGLPPSWASGCAGGYRSDEVFDAPFAPRSDRRAPSDVERTVALAHLGAAGDPRRPTPASRSPTSTRAIRARRTGVDPLRGRPTVTTTSRGETPRSATESDAPQRPDLRVANRQTWIVTGVGGDGSVTLHDRGRTRSSPPSTRKSTSSSLPRPSTEPRRDRSPSPRRPGPTPPAPQRRTSSMTRGRAGNMAHLVAGPPRDAKQQWIDAFARPVRPRPRAPATPPSRTSRRYGPA